MHDFAGYRPGSLAGVVGLHAAYYARDWGFGLAFVLSAVFLAFGGHFVALVTTAPDVR